MQINKNTVTVHDFNKIDSTMKLCRFLKKSEIQDDQYHIFISKQQITGEGQRANQWASPPGNLYANILFKQEYELAKYDAQVTSLSILQSLKTYCLQNEINSEKVDMRMKWINDVFINDKKCAGVLCESEFLGQKCYVSIGIGVNLNYAPLIQDQQTICLKEVIIQNQVIDVDQFMNILFDQLISNLVLLKQHGFVILKNEINKFLQYKGMEVNIYDIKLMNVLNEGKFLGINDHGHAIIQKGEKVIEVFDGRMRLKQ